MSELVHNLTPEESIILAIDTDNMGRAEDLAQIAKEAGAWVVKLGLEFITYVGASECSSLAGDYGLSWVADAKLYDIPNTVAKTVSAYSRLSLPPVGITIATHSGTQSLQAAQAVADECNFMMIGVTHLTSNDEAETKRYEKVLPRTVVWHESRRAVAGGIGGVVCASQELDVVTRYQKTKGLFKMIPGTRSSGADTHDQKRPTTPEEAYVAGADLLVIGREVTLSPDPSRTYAGIVQNLKNVQSRRLGRVA